MYTYSTLIGHDVMSYASQVLCLRVGDNETAGSVLCGARLGCQLRDAIPREAPVLHRDYRGASHTCQGDNLFLVIYYMRFSRASQDNLQRSMLSYKDVVPFGGLLSVTNPWSPSPAFRQPERSDITHVTEPDIAIRVARVRNVWTVIHRAGETRIAKVVTIGITHGSFSHARVDTSCGARDLWAERGRAYRAKAVQAMYRISVDTRLIAKQSTVDRACPSRPSNPGVRQAVTGFTHTN